MLISDVMVGALGGAAMEKMYSLEGLGRGEGDDYIQCSFWTYGKARCYVLEQGHWGHTLRVQYAGQLSSTAYKYSRCALLEDKKNDTCHRGLAQNVMKFMHVTFGAVHL